MVVELGFRFVAMHSTPIGSLELLAEDEAEYLVLRIPENCESPMLMVNVFDCCL